MSRVARLALLALLAPLPLGACRRDLDMQQEARAMTGGGDPAHGQALIQHYGCGACHAIPGVPGARGHVGPPLASLRQDAFIAGVLPHSPENLMRWIQDPPSVDSSTAMPRLGVTERESRDIAAYLYALER